jgi:hypothetical protein
MMRGRQIRSWGMLAAGLAIGLAVGGALTTGLVLGRGAAPQTAGLPALGDLRLQAMASHGSDSFAIATGEIDGEVEGLFTLDFLTGDLQCYVINPRTGVAGGWFKTNVAKDLPPEGSKKPNYLLATGTIRVQGSSGNQRPAGSLCYVVDANTGNAAAYSFFWAQTAAASGAAQASEMRAIGKWKTRTVGVRE